MNSSKHVEDQLLKAVCDGKIKKVEKIIKSHGLSYYGSWSGGYALLLRAIQNDQIQIADLLLAHDCRVNSVHANVDTPLHHAVIKGNMTLIESLLSKSAFIDALDSTGATATHLAIRLGQKHIDVVKLLIEQGASVSVRDNHGDSLLHTAVRTFQCSPNISVDPVLALSTQKLIDFLINSKVPIDALNNKKQTALQLAVQGRKEQIAVKLINLGANLYNADLTRETVLHAAVMQNLNLLTELILNRLPISGGYVKTVNVVNGLMDSSITPLFIAVNEENKAMCELLLKFGAVADISDNNGKTSLHLAVTKLNLDIAELLLVQNADVNKVTFDGMTPLHIACDYRNVEMCELLLKFKAEPNIADLKGKCPLHVAVDRMSYKLADLLLKKNADVNAYTSDCKTPLYIATNRRCVKLCKLLLENGAKVNTSDKADNSPLHLAVEIDSYKIAKILMKNKADIDKTNDKNITPIYLAVENETKNILQLLLMCGACPNISDTDGRSPLYLAVERDSYEMVALLLQYNANVNDKTKENITPVYVAAERGQDKIFTLLIKNGAEVDIQMEKENKNIFHHAVDKGCPQIVEYFFKNFQVLPENYKGLLQKAVLARYANSDKIVTLLVDNGFHFDKDDIHDSKLVSVVVRKGYSKIFEELLKFGLDINVSIEETTPCSLLHSAVRLKQHAIAELLISQGIDINVRDHEQNTSILYAILNSDAEMLQLLLKNVDVNLYSEYFGAAVWLGSHDIVNIFIQNGYKLNVLDSLGETALHYTANSPSTKFEKMSSESMRTYMAKFLLTQGVDIDAVNVYFQTALEMAVENAEVKLTEMLLHHKADITRRIPASYDWLCFEYIEKFLNNPSAHDFMESLPQGSEEEFDLIIKTNCNVLHVAASNFDDYSEDEPDVEETERRNGCFPLLLNWGANFDCKTDEGVTPLHVCVLFGDVENVALLLRHGANPSCQDKNGRTPLCYARKPPEEQAKIFKLLLDFGSDINIVTDVGQAQFQFVEENQSNNAFSLNEKQKIKNMAENLQQHIVKLKAAVLFLSESNLKKSLDCVPPDFQEKCQAEVTALKDERVGNLVISFYDILTSNSAQLTAFWGDESFQMAVKNDDWRKKFPIYEELMYSKLLIAEGRRKLLTECEPILCNVLEPLPDICKQKIMNYFADHELKRLVSLSRTSQAPCQNDAQKE